MNHLFKLSYFVFVGFVVFLHSLCFGVKPVNNICLTWFQENKLSSGSDCLLNCSIADTDMKTFMCPSQCDSLCKKIDGKYNKKLLEKLINYSGLTKAEKKLVKEHPQIATKVFWHAFMTNRRTKKYFKKIGHNSEADAFRHFLWSARLVKSIGPELAQLFLDAHESTNQQPLVEKAMDLANNRGGLLEAIKLKKAGKLTNENIEKSALKHLKQKKLVILKPKGYIPNKVHYL